MFLLTALQSQIFPCQSPARSNVSPSEPCRVKYFSVRALQSQIFLRKSLAEPNISPSETCRAKCFSARDLQSQMFLRQRPAEPISSPSEARRAKCFSARDLQNQMFLPQGPPQPNVYPSEPSRAKCVFVRALQNHTFLRQSPAEPNVSLAEPCRTKRFSVRALQSQMLPNISFPVNMSHATTHTWWYSYQSAIASPFLCAPRALYASSAPPANVLQLEAQTLEAALPACGLEPEEPHCLAWHVCTGHRCCSDCRPAHSFVAAASGPVNKKSRPPVKQLALPRDSQIPNSIICRSPTQSFTQIRQMWKNTGQKFVYAHK